MRRASGIGKMTVDKPAEQACSFPQNLHPRLRIYGRLDPAVENTGLIGKAIPTIPGNTRYFMRYLQHTTCKNSAYCPAIFFRENLNSYSIFTNAFGAIKTFFPILILPTKVALMPIHTLSPTCGAPIRFPLFSRPSVTPLCLQF